MLFGSFNHFAELQQGGPLLGRRVDLFGQTCPQDLEMGQIMTSRRPTNGESTRVTFHVDSKRGSRDKRQGTIP
jgi:hypothetical protein